MSSVSSPPARTSGQRAPRRSACCAPIRWSAARRPPRVANMATSTTGGDRVPDTQFHLLGTPGAPAATGFDAYRKQGGYTALQRAVTTMSPDQVLAEVHASGLRGRGGAGVLTAEKLTLVEIGRAHV